MKTLLRIDCSARTIGSHSRELADFCEQMWKTEHPNGIVLHRDLTVHELPHIQNETIGGFYTPLEKMSNEQKEATALSDDLIAELKQADQILISSPLYNLNVPSNLKAYLDQVTRIGHTFGINENGYFGLLKNITAIIVTVKGGVYKGTPMEAYDFQEPYLKAILGHMGIEIQHLFSLEGTGNSESLDQNKIALKKVIGNAFIKN